jgi:hypothetical protein
MIHLLRTLAPMVMLVAGLTACGAALAVWEGRRRSHRRAAELIARAMATPSLTLTMRQGTFTPHAGAIPGWSPIIEQAEAEAARDPMAEAAAAERAELADAAAELAPLLAAERTAMAAAFRQFDAAMLMPMRTAQAWHQRCRGECVACARVIGPVGPGRKIGLRAWRTDTPTGEYAIVQTIDHGALVAALLEA